MDRLAERDPDVFDEVVTVEAVAARAERQPAAGVLRERFEHVIEELHVGLDLGRAAGEIESELDPRLFRRSGYGRAARAGSFFAHAVVLPFLTGALGAERPRCPIGMYGITGGPS